MADNNVIQKNWQELIKPDKLQVAAGPDPKRVARAIARHVEKAKLLVS